MRILLSAIAVVSLLIGCESVPKTTRDIPPAEATWMNGRRTTADGTKLKMIFESDPLTSIKGVDYKVRDGELDLWTIRGSERFQPIEFALDTSKLKLKQPWQEHVYWVGTVHWD